MRYFVLALLVAACTRQPDQSNTFANDHLQETSKDCFQEIHLVTLDNEPSLTVVNGSCQGASKAIEEMKEFQSILFAGQPILSTTLKGVELYGHSLQNDFLIGTVKADDSLVQLASGVTFEVGPEGRLLFGKDEL